jgi:HEPN domain-containing protein
MKHHTAQWVRKAEEDADVARSLSAQATPPRDAICFHCQQAIEKYLKALLQELGAAVPKTHDLEGLLDLLVPHDRTLDKLRRRLKLLQRYAVEYRYPGLRATTRQMQSALRAMNVAREEMRLKLGLPS